MQTQKCDRVQGFIKTVIDRRSPERSQSSEGLKQTRSQNGKDTEGLGVMRQICNGDNVKSHNKTGPFAMHTATQRLSLGMRG